MTIRFVTIRMIKIISKKCCRKKSGRSSSFAKNTRDSSYSISWVASIGCAELKDRFFSSFGFYIEVRQSFSGDSVLRCASLVRLHRTSSLAERFWPESARPFFSTDPLYRPGCMLRRWFGYKYLFETKTSRSFTMMRDFGQEFCFQAACYNRKVFRFQ